MSVDKFKNYFFKKKILILLTILNEFRNVMQLWNTSDEIKHLELISNEL